MISKCLSIMRRFKMPKKNDFVYCWNCGMKNKKSNKKCEKCQANLKEQEHPILHWLFGETVDEIQGNFFSKGCQALMNFFHIHLYGATVGLALVFAIGSSLLHFNTPDHIETVNETYLIAPKEELSSNPDAPVGEEFVCEEGYQLEGNRCMKVETVAAIVNESCSEGSFLDGGECFQTVQKDMQLSCCKSKEDMIRYAQSLGYLDDESKYANDVLTSVELSTVGMDGVTPGDWCVYHFNEGIDADHTFSLFRPPFRNYTCPTGTVEVNTFCRLPVEKIITYTCEEGYTLTDDHTCTKTVTKEPIKR